MIDDVVRHRSTLYNFCFMRAQLTAVIVALAVAAAQPGRRSVSLIVIGRTVITENAARRILSPGAVAISGTDIVDVDRPDAIASRYTARETIDARDQGILPG